MDSFFKDVKHGTRLLLKSPGISLISILALTLGIGLSVTMFSIVYGALFRGLPFDQSERIMHIEHSNLPRGWQSMEIGAHDYLDYRAAQRSFTELAAFRTGTTVLSGTERAERFEGGFVTANTFPLLGVKAIMGRTFLPEEDVPGAPKVALIGYQLWQQRYEGDRAIVGKSIRIDGEPATIVGVMPDKFLFPENQQIWIPLKPDPVKDVRGRGPTYELFGRLRPGLSIDDAMTDFTTIARRLETEHPETNKDLRPVIKPFTEEYVGDEPRVLLFTMLGAVFFVLLIGCTNVANLLLGRAIMRSKEVGIRTALGANRWRLITQFLTEALVLSVAGAILGIGLGWIGVRAFNNAIASTQPPFWIDIRMDGVALLFVLALTLLTALISGTIPALQASRRDVTDVLKDESRGASSFRLGRISRALVVFEMALSCGLLVAAGLTIKSVVKLRNVDLGFPTEKLFTTRIALDANNYSDSLRIVQFYDKVLQEVSQLPEVEIATIASSLPGLGEGNWSFGIEGQSYERDQDYPDAPRATVHPSYFETLGIQAVEGRLLNETDRIGSLPVVVVNRAFVSKYFNGQSPLGKRIRYGGGNSTLPWLTIVGVVSDVQSGSLEPPRRREAAYVPFAQVHPGYMNLIARTRGEPLAIAGAVRNIVTATDVDIPIYFTDTLMGRIAQETWFYRVFGVLFMVFGFAALLLASIGLYAVMAFSVSQRTREVGIRMAIGAQTRDVMRMILRQGLLQVGLGIVLGLGLAAGVAHLLTIILFDVQPRDPFVFGAIILVLTVTALAACLVPARRATAVDPLEALRYE